MSTPLLLVDQSVNYFLGQFCFFSFAGCMRFLPSPDRQLRCGAPRSVAPQALADAQLTGRLAPTAPRTTLPGSSSPFRPSGSCLHRLQTPFRRLESLKIPTTAAGDCRPPTRMDQHWAQSWRAPSPLTPWIAVDCLGRKMVRDTGFEPVTPTVSR
jgi:hypothetical protein